MGGVVCVAIGGSLINNILTQNGVDPNNFAVIYTHPEIYAKATQAIFRQCKALLPSSLVCICLCCMFDSHSTKSFVSFMN